MIISRRGFTLGAASAFGLASQGAFKPAFAQSEPIKIGWLGALTGPSSAPAIGFDRGLRYAVDAVNASGGVKGRKIDLITRDTQGDPTKAVNATQEMISSIKVHAIWGPTNSGEALATTPIMARAKMPNIHPCVVNSLIDPVKYPNAFRMAPSNSQWDDAVRNYCLKILKVKKVAVIGDTTGYGTTAAGDSVAAFKKDGADVVYSAQIDATQPDMTPDMLRMKNAGAEAIVSWSTSTGMAARLFNARAALNWDVPFVGHPSLGSGEVGKLIEKPANWDKVYTVNYRSCSFDAQGKLPERTQAFLDKASGKIDLKDTLLWWVLSGVDVIELLSKAVAESGGTASEGIIKYLNGLSKYPGLFGDYTWSPTQHNGYPTDEVVMGAANSSKDGALNLAPGYG
ncbi:ABC transporter substrate-binding protein [Bradyrhizobium sp. ARR65]|uniref:ABC transporter substrate-binding protein n=1 Tax=Bradyrhizobium sp. ARR65 TaxID=1040989 RepID=UPI0004670323|nr:ABC transporter substrate-binding protein [Bradyrhizobium sp. ARR65]